MDTDELAKYQNVTGVPGAGKTSCLVAVAIAAAKRVGPEQISCITFTRTAAEELRQRVADALGLQGDTRSLRRQLPWCGTVHAIAMRLAGVSGASLVDGKKLKSFSSSFSGDIPSPEHADAFWLPEPTRQADITEAMLWVSSAARHRLWPVEDVLHLLDPRLLGKIGADNLLDLIQEYYRWKDEHNYVDFEDLLELGQQIELPVKALFADEAQDNSALLWETVNRWGNRERVQTYMAFGDPFQAIFSYMGAFPQLFMERSGTWHRLLTSHRFNQGDCNYARRIVSDVFGADASFLDAWRGTGASPGDGSAFFLARTNALVARKVGSLLESGTPFRYIRGRSAPLSTKAADAFRTILMLQRGDLVSRDQLINLGEQDDSPGTTKRLAPLRALPAAYYGMGTARSHLRPELLGVDADIQYGDYFREIRRVHGEGALFRTPKLGIGTFHSAKGREADEVTVCTSWAKQPARNIVTNPEQECTVAYVATTRHRTKLTLEPVFDGGIPYPFP